MSIMMALRSWWRRRYFDPARVGKESYASMVVDVPKAQRGKGLHLMTWIGHQHLMPLNDGGSWRRGKSEEPPP